ncbi:MAG: hypothetical protein NTX85_00355 [Candidatus Nomurabacteria bacterium]|nr:hypothetical protein [Candidatus Nomurabacteria bacterium]
MITLDLVEFIEKEQKKDVSNDVIKSRLLEAGWNSEDIEEGLAKVVPAYDFPVVTSVQKDISTLASISVVRPAVDPYREAPIDKVAIKDNFSTPNPSQSLPKVWAPANTPIAVEEKHEPMPTLMPKISTPEVIPAQNKTLPPPFSPERKMELAKVHATPEPTINPIPSISSAPANNSFANKAMISSYPKDIKNNFVFEGEKKHGVPKFLVWIFVFVVILCIAAGVSFAYTNGLINIPFLPKVNPNAVTVDFTKNISNSNKSEIVPADTTPISSQNNDSTPDNQSPNDISPIESKVDVSDPANQVVAVEISTADELKGKDSMIENYVSSIELQIYKKYALNKNKYGTVANAKGDCVAPIKDSLFYADPADTSDKTIAHFLNPLLELESSKGYCFSNTKSWAMSFPLATDENSYVCLDSNSSKIYTKNILSGTVCK